VRKLVTEELRRRQKERFNEHVREQNARRMERLPQNPPPDAGGAYGILARRAVGRSRE